MQHFLVPQITQATTAVATGASAANTVIPDAADGDPARYVMLQAEPGAWCLARPNQNGTELATTFFIVDERPKIINVAGFSHIRHQEGSAAAVLRITPLDNQ